MDWFLYDIGLGRERVNIRIALRKLKSYKTYSSFFKWCNSKIDEKWIGIGCR